jgi:hypothetical protein
MTLKLKKVTTSGMRGMASIPFPSNVVGAGGISVTKEGATYTIDFSNSAGAVLGPASSIDGNFAQFDGITGKLIKGGYSVASLIALAIVETPTFDIAAGTYAVTTETTLLINKTVPAAHNITLPTAASRNGVRINIKDIAGNAATHVATIVPNGSEKIDGLSTLPVNSNYGGFKLFPITGGWYISP